MAKLKIKGLLGNEKVVNTMGKYHEGNTLNDLTGSEWKFHTKSWLMLDGARENLYNHPATFPVELATHFIEFFTKKGDVVIDPFSGVGTTAIASLLLKRKAFTMELNLEFVKSALLRIMDYHIKTGDDLKLICENSVNINLFYPKDWKPAKFVFSSPPFFDMFKARGGVESTFQKRLKKGFENGYGNVDGDLSKIDDYNQFIGTLAIVYKKCLDLMADGAYMVIVVQNTLDENDIYRTTAFDLAISLSKYASLRQEFVWCQNQKNLGIWGYPTKYISNVHHSYCLVFQKSKKELVRIRVSV